MARYNNSFRMVHYNGAGCGDAVTTIDKKTYNELKAIKPYGATFHGNAVVKTVSINDFYELYETIRNISLKRRLGI